MKDADIVQEAYADALKGLYSVLFDSLVAAAGSKQAETKAEEAFKAGLAFARTTRDRALEFVK